MEIRQKEATEQQSFQLDTQAHYQLASHVVSTQYVGQKMRVYGVRNVQVFNQKVQTSIQVVSPSILVCGLKFMSVAFAFGLGTTHPCAIAVHMEPFSTSALKDLT